MRAFAVLFLAIVGLALVIGLWIYSTYNGLVSLDEETNKAFAQVDVVLQRRFDLIPNLVETVKGYASHEKEVFTAVTEARSRIGQATTPQARIDAENQMTGALSRLLMVAENYPQLKANENFLALQDELSGTENRISVERRRYNEVATEYNKKIRRVPGNMVAGMFGFERRNLLEAPTEARQAPKVKF
ncbi:LemA family protein [candidate division KSB1 bacterium]|nr:MAG: LemA family protein [candidate division KSB1 bacterium]